jgi:hypothetical protein
MLPVVLSVARAKQLIIAEWHTWAKKRGAYTITDMQIFYFAWLKQNRPELLTFKCDGERWPVVRTWLRHDEDRHVRLMKFRR